MVTIYLTRHGETKWNRENRLQGWKNSELTEKGIEHARRLGERLNQTQLTAIYSSPSDRALQTAQYVRAEREIPIHVKPKLKEIFLGEWEGKTREEIEGKSLDEYSNFWNAPHLYDHQPHQAESLAAFKKRVENVLKEIISENSNGNILIVTHAVAIKAILSFILAIPTEKLWDPPFIHGTSLTIFDWDGEMFDVKLVGDTTHID